MPEPAWRKVPAPLMTFDSVSVLLRSMASVLPLATVTVLVPSEPGSAAGTHL